MFKPWPRTAVAIALTSLAVVSTGCEAIDDGGAPAPAALTGPNLALLRSPLGVAGKPVIDSASGAVVADELLVRFDEALPGDAAEWIAHTAGGQVSYVGPHSGYAVVRFADDAAAAAGAARLRASGLVKDVTRNHVLTGESEGPSGTGIGTSPSFELGILQWNLYAMGLNPFGARAGAAGVTVAVLDTGVAYENYADAHGSYAQAPDLAGVDFAAGWDFVNNDAHPNDDQRHGTHVTGVIAAARGIASVAPGATILPVKVLDNGNSGTELALAEGLRFAADHGARVINMSLSFPPTYFPSRMLQSAVDYAAQKGVIMIAAVGNHGEGIVAYPAAFRDVIAVGASDVPPWYHSWGSPTKQWKTLQPLLVAAGYSNRSYKVDVVAPGGSIPGDANFDGKPEAILAQTFAPGDPMHFGYYFYAGTSQAAAEVTGVAAAMLAADPGLDSFAVRSILTENARPLGWKLLSPDTGRGAVRADRAIAAAADGDRVVGERERFNANIAVTLHNAASGGAVYARARVEVLSAADARPAKYVRVYGMFTGAAFGSVSAETDASGVAEFWSPPLAGNQVVAFQADGVSRGCGPYSAFDRPRGFLRIESRSLARLAQFAYSLQVNDSAAAAGGAGEASSGVDGTGIGTSPSGPDYELPTDPQQTPLTVAYDPQLFAGTRYRPTLLMPNFSWGLATVPMAVAVDESWFLATFPGAAARRVISRGTGLSVSPLRFDETSFPVTTFAPAIDDIPSVSLLVVTFASATGVGTSPSGQGLGTSPSGQGLGTSPSSGFVIVDRSYSGLDSIIAADIDRLFAGVFAAGAGLGTSPSYSVGSWSFSFGWFTGLSTLAHDYALFADTAAAAPAAAYGAALGAASMPLAPVAPEADGPGVGAQTLP